MKWSRSLGFSSSLGIRLLLLLLCFSLSCDNKDVKLVTNVEYEFSFSLVEREAFVGDALALELEIVPEEVVEGFSYFAKVEVLEGSGKLEDSEGKSYPVGEDIELLEDTDFRLSLFYIPTSSGTQKIKISSKDNFEKSTSEEVSVVAKDVPFVWRASSDATTLVIDQEGNIPSATVNVTLEKNKDEDKQGITFSRVYSVVPPGSIRLVEQQEGGVNTSVALGSEEEIEEGRYAYVLEPTIEEGSITLTLLARDSNGQEVERSLTFQVEKEGTDPDPDTKSSENDIVSFAIDGLVRSASIDKDTHSVEVNVPFGTDLTGLTPIIAVSEKASIDPPSRETRDFTTPVIYTVTAEDGTAQEWSVTITAQDDTRSSENDIISFSLEGRNATINTTNHTVALQLPFDTDLTSLTPTIEVSEDATISPQANQARDFSAPVSYTVTAENEDTQTWTVNVTKQADTRSRENDITTFAIPGQVSTSQINTTAHTVNIVMPFDATLTSLTPNITVSNEATLTPNSGQARDFSSPVSYSVTAENETTQTWTVTVTKQADTRSRENDITSFEIGGTSQLFTNTHTVTVTVPFDTDISSLSPQISVSDGAAITPSSGQPQNFSAPVNYTVTAENGDAQTWTVLVTKEADTRSNANNITSFTITGQVGTTSINTASHSVSATIRFDADVSNTSPMIGISPDATISPTGARNFSQSGVTYTVTAENGDAQAWTVTIIRQPDPRSSANDITAFTLPNQVGSSIINTTSHTVQATMPYNTLLVSLTPTITVSTEATISPTGARNFTSPVNYTITAENGTPQVWTVTVTRQDPPPNRPPVARNDNYEVKQNKSISMTVLSNDSDPDNHSLSIISNTNPIRGTINRGTTRITYNATNTTGAVTFRYTISDGNGGTDSATVTVTVVPDICEGPPPGGCKSDESFCVDACACVPDDQIGGGGLIQCLK